MGAALLAAIVFMGMFTTAKAQDADAAKADTGITGPGKSCESSDILNI
jgi:hypothetical protein